MFVSTSKSPEEAPASALEYIITHIFCPIKLPQHDDYTAGCDHALLDVVLGSAHNFVNFLPNSDQGEWGPLLRMLENLGVTTTSPSLPKGIELQIGSMRAGDILAYLIRAQNAAVVIRRFDTETIFESFEVSPPGPTVMRAKGKLLCSYPGPAIVVPNSIVDNPTFPPELANFLIHMSHDVLNSAPRPAEAPSEVLGQDGTAHPRYITELLTGFFRAFGKPANIYRIRKRIGDDVLWSHANLPWRRSSLWLVIRVVLQTSLERTSLGRKGYKFFMASLMKDLASKALEADLSSDLLYFMCTKITRRLIKLQAEDELLAMVMNKATENIKDRLELRWKDVQAVQADSPHWDASEEDITRDTRLSLTKSEEYIAGVLHHSHLHSSVPDSQPSHRRRGTLSDFLGPDNGFFENAYAEDPFLALSDFECAVECDINGWVAIAVNSDDARIHTACLIVQACGTSYSSKAQLSYSKNPENMSIMLLTLFELWVALDKLVVKSIPLLKEYLPDVPVTIFHRLLLQKAVAIERLDLLQRYVATRIRHATLGVSVFSDSADENTFAVRYYGQSEELKSCKSRIEHDANVERTKRIAELHEKGDKYKRLTNEIDALTCDTYTTAGGRTNHNKWRCHRCKKRKERDNLSIEVHEWPLPKNEYHAAVVIFELGGPVTFKIRRSFTVHFLHDICAVAMQSDERATQYELLTRYKSLSSYCVKHPGQRITLGSKKQSFLTSRDRIRSIPCTEHDICVDNKLDFHLYDTAKGVWLSSDSFQKIDISGLCTHELSPGPYRGLQRYLSGTQHTSNEVLATQAMCHADMTLHEFIAFGSLRSGSLLQWINILRELRARTLTFRDPAVHLLLLQAAWEVGELSEDGSRVWHDELRVPEFGHALINELQSLRVSVEANWLEGITMATISALASRLLSSAEDFGVIQQTYRLLQAVRNATFKWVQELSNTLQGAPDKSSLREHQARIRDMAAICRSTYDVGPDNINELLLSPYDLEVLAYCAVTVRDNTPSDLCALLPVSRLLLERDRRLSYFLETYVRRHVEDDQEGLDWAMKQLWPSYRRHTRWTVLESPNSRWLRCETAPSDYPLCQTILLDILTGRLLVDGKPLARLPDDFMRHSSYAVLFSHQVLDVFPTRKPGAEFVTKAYKIQGQQIDIFFGMRGGEVVIRSQHKDGQLLELIPPEKLELDIPATLVNNHVHWLDLSSHGIEFRPMATMWEQSDKNWVLHFEERGHSVAQQGQSTLFDICSPTFCKISKMLSPLEDSRYMVATRTPHAGQMVVHVDLPRFGLSFFIDEDGELQSCDKRDMVVDENQLTGTMLGLVNQLVLRPKDRQTYNDRHVIIPQGDVRVQPRGHHVQVTIHPSPNQARHRYHRYTIDTELCRLAGPVGITNQLYKAYLHALCSAHVPDPLTRRTGVEEAIHLLQSASCYSFTNLDPLDCEILAWIGSLTADRTWRHVHTMSMQEVHWQPELSSYIQSCAFYHAARNIVQYAQRLQSLSETPITVCLGFPVREESLLERASQRSTVLYSRDSVNSFNYPSESSSSEYLSRDVVHYSKGEQRAFDCASMVRNWSVTLEPCQALYNVFRQWDKVVSGETKDISFHYDRDWLKPDLAKRWMSVYELCHDIDQTSHTFQLAFTLSAMAYSTPENMEMAATIFAFVAIPDFRAIRSPGYDMYDLSLGLKPEEQRLRRHISFSTTFHKSPEASLSISPRESSVDFETRRQALFQSKCLREETAAVTVLLDSWPWNSIPTHALRCLSDSRHDKSNLKAILENVYSYCYRNHCLKTYLDDVQNTLDEVRRTSAAYVKQPYTFTPSNSAVLSVATSIFTEDLFKKPPPVITLPLDPLVHQQSHDLPSYKSSDRRVDSLEHVISSFAHSQSNEFGRQYAEHLEDSRRHLENDQPPILPHSACWTADMLQLHHMRCSKHYNNAFRRLEEHLAPSGLGEESLFNSGQWPRITVTFMLGLLASGSKVPLCDLWKASLVNFAHLLLRLQRSRRLLKLEAAGDHEEFLKELENDGYQGVDATPAYLDWLLIEIENRFLIRRMQASVAIEMISPNSGGNTALQLHMGEGKSSVIVPICCAALADGNRLVRVVTLKPLTMQMFRLLVERLGGLTNRRIFYLPFSRLLRITSEHASTIQSLFDECKDLGGILVAQPEHILSFKLMTVEHLCSPMNAGAQSSTELATHLLNSQRWLDMHTRDILDESDELLHVRFQMVYTMGDQQHLEGYPDRWTTTQQVMTLVAKHAHGLHQEFPLGVELQPGPVGGFSRFRVFCDHAGEKLVQMVSNDILAGDLPNFAFAHLPFRIKDAIRKCFTVSAVDMQCLDQVQQYCAGSGLWNVILLIRGLLAHGILVCALRERRWRIDYGLDPQRTMLAVPYRAKDMPSCRAEFGHPDIAIALTCLSYYYGGLDEKQLAICFRHLLKQDNPVVEYETWIKDLSRDSLPENLQHLSGINTESTEQFAECLVPLFGCNKAVIDFYLAQIIFPKEAKQFPYRLSCSAWDLAERKSSGLPTTGFSGTNDFRYLLPATITQHALAHQRGTNARVLTYLLQQENDHYNSHTAGKGARELLRVIAKQSPEIRVLLDVGAQVLDLQNDELAGAWLEINQDALAAIYFNKNDELVVRGRDQVIEPFNGSYFAQQLDQCVLYLDDAHTRGTDIKLPRQFRAAVTLGPKVTKDRLVQGCMRMRKLGHGHSVMFFAPQDVDHSIREVNSKGDADDIHVSDILVWAMTETCAEIQHRSSQWLQQGVDYKTRHGSWSSLLSDDIAPVELSGSWLQREAKRLEELYAQAQTPQSLVDEELLERCKSLGLRILPDSHCLDEEQEREVVQEIEREREVERPPQVPAVTHSINEGVLYFIRTGCIPNGSSEFTAMFDTLTNTSAAFSGSQPWTQDVLVSRDFTNTVRVGLKDKMDSYIRPVNWILSSTTSGVPPVLVIVSPFEVNALLPDIRASRHVHLHVYTPRVIKMMKSCDDMRLYSVPSLPARWRPDETLIRQLNIFAGQLYFPHRRAYVKLCRFLGIYTTDLADQGAFEIQSDGFMRPGDRPPAADYPNGFQQSPIPILKAIFSFRRKGTGYLPTHIGKLLSARRLENDDFEETA
ncbi:hypothetical protein M405DRAFT_756250 [Rhizopogon salebrosus TDB-379]|nr:hypothetical protein M405DRAFT_756250 [Rhizopogon salebrosus TDB-379]